MIDTETLQVPLVGREGEALLWGLAMIGDYTERVPDGPEDPLTILFEAGYTSSAVQNCSIALEVLAYGDCLTGPFTELESLILRLAVERSSFLTAYRDHVEGKHGTGLLAEAQAALRGLAEKLDQFGIEVQHLPE